MLFEKDFVFEENLEPVVGGSFQWSAPSNIALVKYWGKKEHQIPANPSLSFTLNQCKTITKVDFAARAIHPDNYNSLTEYSFDLLFEGKAKEEFKPKIQKFLERIEKYCPYLKQYHITIDTQNTFPHSSGIASSASGMAALAMNIMSLEKAINPKISEDYFYHKASFLARLGSGSACRSIKGNVVAWGSHADIATSSDLYGVPYPFLLHDNFKNYQDVILLVDKGEKQVSSTVGHDLMHNHPFAPQRFEQTHHNLKLLLHILQTGNLDEFITIVESEALTLHAMMMTSLPYFILMKPKTLEIIQKIWDYRNRTNIPICFTLDAGANVHILFPENVSEACMSFITSELVGYCQNGQYICDQLGIGSQLISSH